MTDEPAPILGVAPLEAGEDPPALEEAPVTDLDESPVLDRDGRKVIAQVLRMEGEIVRALRGVPAEEPDAWRWTKEEVDALMPALAALTERYGMASAINANAPHAGAAIAVVMHANRSLAAERAWRASHAEDPHPDPEGPTDEPEPDAEPDRAPPDQPGTALGPADIAGVAGHLASGITGGAR